MDMPLDGGGDDSAKLAVLEKIAELMDELETKGLVPPDADDKGAAGDGCTCDAEGECTCGKRVAGDDKKPAIPGLKTVIGLGNEKASPGGDDSDMGKLRALASK